MQYVKDMLHKQHGQGTENKVAGLDFLSAEESALNDLVFWKNP